jgi:hypothetical protein
MPNILSDYSDIIETYLIGLRTQLNANYEFYFDAKEGSVTFKRNIPAASKNGILAIKYVFDKETLEHEHPDAEVLKVGVLWTLKSVITKSIMKFSDQFYQDRANGVPLVSDEVMDMTNKDGSISTVRLDSIDWVEFFKV